MKFFQIQTAHLIFLSMDLVLLLKLQKSQGFVCSCVCSVSVYGDPAVCQALFSAEPWTAQPGPLPLWSWSWLCTFVPCPCYPEGVFCPGKKSFIDWLIDFSFSLFARLIICIKGLSPLRIPGVWLSTVSQPEYVFFINSSQAPGSLLTGLAPPLFCRMSSIQRRLGGSRFSFLKGGRLPCLPVGDCFWHLTQWNDSISWWEFGMQVMSFIELLLCGISLVCHTFLKSIK